MYEVEVKVPADRDTVRRRLEALEATHERTVEHEDTYYDAPDRDFAETDEALRIRRETVASDSPPTRRAYLTYKGPLVDDQSKTREEHETLVEDGAELAAVLSGLGHEEAATVEKHRERYAVDDLTVVLDRVACLGEFVEVERESDDVEAARESVFEGLRRLDLDPDDQLRTSYLEMTLDDSQE